MFLPIAQVICVYMKIIFIEDIIQSKYGSAGTKYQK